VMLVAATGSLEGGPGAALHGGSTTVKQGGVVGVTSGRKKGCSWGGRGWAPFIASRGGGRRRRGGKSGGGETVVGNRGHGKSTAATV
jgi:hypothetical protein